MPSPPFRVLRRKSRVPHQGPAMTAAPAPSMRTTYDNIPRTPYYRPHLELSFDPIISKIGQWRIEIFRCKEGGESKTSALRRQFRVLPKPRKSLDTIQKKIRSPMLHQTQIISFFKPKKLSSGIFTSCPSSAPRPCFPTNRAAGTSQIAADAKWSKSSKSSKLSKSPKSTKFNAVTSCLCSALRIYYSVNQTARTSHIAPDSVIQSFLQVFRALIKQLIRIFVVSDKDTSSSRTLFCIRSFLRTEKRNLTKTKKNLTIDRKIEKRNSKKIEKRKHFRVNRNQRKFKLKRDSKCIQRIFEIRNSNDKKNECDRRKRY